jgi:bifunctional UDP-N-acetylglucosamine pyrophosphorylase/glucosamine-1-phosphate N-acetyltransferase
MNPAKTDIRLAEELRDMRRRINAAHMNAGVHIIDPDHTYIDDNVRIGTGTVIYPGAILEGGTVIGSNCVIGANVRIVECKLADSIEIWYSMAVESTIGCNTSVGPYAYVRPGSNIGSNVRIGNFVEIKNSNICDGTCVSHLTYVGDSDVGTGVNFGCGTVTVNYDGKAKHRTTIGDNAFIGCNTNLIAPVTVGNGAYTAAGTTVTADVPDGSLAIARARQTNLEGYAKRYLKD